MNETQFVQRVQSGDPKALEELTRELRPGLFRYLRRLVRNHADAEDLTQETLIKVFVGLRNFRWISSVSTWAYRIATCTAMDHLRKPENRRTFPLDMSYAEQLPGSDPRGIAARAIAIDDSDLDHALQELSDSARAALILQCVEELTISEIAVILQKTESAVKALVFRAKETLAKKLNRSRKKGNQGRFPRGTTVGGSK